ncbi:MAG: hypothetical protein BGO78_08005 [Chloroflexi bacterium 44-23]|nr:MAG: hypothetical protein BGO78_08005 [Chloroflexi bacterium 44-23]
MQFIDCKYVKIEIYAPAEALPVIVAEFSKAGAGRFGLYDHVYTTSAVTGHWRPLEGAVPTIGSVGKDEQAQELKIEVNCPKELARKVKEAVRKVHPYEAPVINIIPLCNDQIEEL